jgi:hypothetical protein
MADTISKLSSSHTTAKQTASDLGKLYESKNNDYKKALASGEQGKIGEAKLELDKAQENYMGFLTTMNKEHDMIMQLIAMLGR